MDLKEKVIAEIRKIYDPEIPVNIYELGLIYDVKVNESKAKIIMTLTTPNCPVAESLPKEVKEGTLHQFPLRTALQESIDFATTQGKINLFGNVNIAFGTDSGVSRHGTNAREFELMVLYGMDQNSAIKTATINAATLLGKENVIGKITPGMQADMVATDTSPLQDISVLKDITFVMKLGRVYKNK